MDPHALRSLDPMLEATWARARWAAAENDFESAVRGYQLVTDLDPRNIDASEAFCRVLSASGRPHSAAAESLRLAALYASAGSSREALAAVSRALHLEPAVFVRHRLASLLFAMGQPIEALCRRAIEHHMAAQRSIEARELLQLLVEARPRDPALRQQLAELELGLGHAEQAARCLRAVVKLHRAAGDTEAFAQAADQLLRLAGPDPELLRELVAVDLRANRTARALERLELLQRLCPSDRALLERLATLQAKLGRTPSALESLWRLVRALGRDGDDDQVRDLLRRARRWHDSTRHHEAIDALARKVLTARAASEINAPGWACVEPRHPASRRRTQPFVAAPPPPGSVAG